VIRVLDSDETGQADLRGGRSPWFASAERSPRFPVDANLKCDGLVVGAGITGSLVAERLTRQGARCRDR
jgi:NADPH-dependent 2,4-dienoyl-CoA reductase/sulfur reductase-like enzyme